MELSKPRFGVGLFDRSLSTPEAIVNFALTAEKFGFDSVWMPDHAFFPFEALTTLTAVAVKTRNVKVGTCVIDLNRRHPATLAQSTSTIDIISGGRFILGVGKGVKNEPTYGVRVYEQVSRMLEILKITKMFWTDPVVNYRGSFYTFENASIGTRPLQKPHPPVWVAAFGPRMIKIAAEIGDGFITQNMSPEMYQEKLNQLRETAKKAGRDRKEITAVFSAPMSISLEREAALMQIEPWARDFLSRYAKPPWSFAEKLGYRTQWTKPEEVPIEAIDRCYIFGTPDECVSKVDKYLKAGVEYFICLPLLPATTDSLKLFSKKVIEYFKEYR